MYRAAELGQQPWQVRRISFGYQVPFLLLLGEDPAYGIDRLPDHVIAMIEHVSFFILDWQDGLGSPFHFLFMHKTFVELQ